MGSGQKFITTALWTVLLLGMGGVLVGKFLLPRFAHKPAPSTLPVLYPAAEFSLTDQEAKPFASKDLRGRPYVVAFVFTQCAGVCPQMSTAMTRLQGQLPAESHLVSVSVDPDHDTPEVLKEYAKTYKADPARWHFLTGTKEQVFRAAADMKLAAMPQEGENPILHSEKLLLVDGEGNVRGYYNGTKDEEIARLVTDAKTLAKP